MNINLVWGIDVYTRKNIMYLLPNDLKRT